LPEAEFAGLSAALYLDKTLARRGEAEVTLISRPELHSVRAAGLTRRFASSMPSPVQFLPDSLIVRGQLRNS